MKESSGIVRSLAASALLALASAPAAAQDCRLSVAASDSVLLPGETAQVHVLAHFPHDAFAFAAAEFDVAADMPGWSFASDGAIAGANVLGIAPSQEHRPFEGIFADPANPIRIWTGVFEPASYDPMLVQVEALPQSFWYYPSELTSSSVECEAGPGRDWVFVNPEPFGAASVAPGEGTTMEFGGAGRDVLIGNTGGDRILIGMLVPAVQKVRVGPWEAPDSLTIEVGFDDTAHYPIESMSFNYTKAHFDSPYRLETRWPLAVRLEYVLLLDGELVGSFDAEDGVAPFALERLPDAHSTRINRLQHTRPHPAKVAPSIICTLAYDAAVGAIFQGGKRAEADTVQVRMSCSNNLKQIGLAAHNVYDVRGQASLTFKLE